METNLEYAKTVAKQLLYVEPRVTSIPFIISHPFISNNMVYDTKTEHFLDIFEEDNMNKIRDSFSDLIDKADSLGHLFMYINKPYRAVYFKMVNKELSEKDYNEYLAYVWTDSENPNQDPNVSIPLWIRFFKRANKNILMSSEDKEIYDDLPEDDKILIYRGVGKDREPFGLSWTNNIKTAKWFANRWGNDEAYMFKANCYKKDVLAYFNSRNENELVVNVKNIFDVEKVMLNG
jgi:hypothetical protein